MKISIIRFLSEIDNKQFRDFLTDLINNMGMIKRDFMQNKCDQFKDDVCMPVWNCIKFISNRLSKKFNIPVSELDVLDNLKKTESFPHIYYDLEDCYQQDKTVLCTIIIQDKDINYLFTIDIVNTNMMLINSKDIYKLDLGPRIRSYKDSTKIYSIIYNAVFFKHHKTYMENKDSELFNILFRPLYEKIYIQSGFIV